MFRFADLDLGAGEEGERATKNAFVERTIRSVRPGLHRFTLLANGAASEPVEVRVREA